MELKGNIRKACNYMKRNGLVDTIFASVERLSQDSKPYEYKDIDEETRKKQREARFDVRTRFSIVVPTYETNEIFARAMIRSVLEQTYPTFELIIADASSTNKVEEVVRSFGDDRITYMKMTDNRGISENTNAGIAVASGQYIGLLDHDDLLTCDALYEMARAIEKAKKDGIKYAFLYSDEDKCDTFGERFYEPNFKPEFNLDLLLSNNYICHFMVMESKLMKKLMLRSEYDGAQDHDLVLRACGATDNPVGKVDKVLYHWRCHEDSTASNPESKLYAYEAGRRAVQNYLDEKKIAGAVIPTKHNGFFRVCYGSLSGTGGEINSGAGAPEVADIFKYRFDIGVVGGPIKKHGRIVGGLLDETRTCPLEGVNVNFSGYMHRNSLQTDVYAVDVREMYLRKELFNLFFEKANEPKYRELFNYDLTIKSKEYIFAGDYFNARGIDETTIQDFSVEFCNAAKMEGYLIFYDPCLEELV